MVNNQLALSIIIYEQCHTSMNNLSHLLNIYILSVNEHRAPLPYHWSDWCPAGKAGKASKLHLLFDYYSSAAVTGPYI
jgi:hypothetical protein